MRFTCLAPTLNRPELLKRCIQSLLDQTFSDFEIIVVDQSDDSMFDDSIPGMSPSIKYIRISERGLSHARNVGLEHASGDYVCLIDDDAVYPRNVLEVADRIISDVGPAVLGGRLYDPETGIARSIVSDKTLRWRESFVYLMSPCMVIKRSLLEEHPFDENFGVGARYGCGEETDIVFAAFSKRELVYYTDRYSVYHHLDENRTMDFKRIESYSYGYGALCGKIMRDYSRFWGLYFFWKTLVGNFLMGYLFRLCTDAEKARARRIRASQAWRGFWDYKRFMRTGSAHQRGHRA